MKIVSIVGARPQFIKLAPISHAIARSSHSHVVIHTGQHYDANMSDVFFDDLDIAAPKINLSVGSGSHGQQTAHMLAAIETKLEAIHPDWVLVYGDTNSTAAGVLAATKMNIPVAHLEAGLRSFNRAMPEEINRILADHLSDLCLAPTLAAVDHLKNEGLSDRTVHVGDVMTDVLLKTRDEISGSARAELRRSINVGGKYYLSTIHRPSNTDDRARLIEIVSALDALPHPVVLAAHPRLQASAQQFGINLDRANIRLVPPLPYPQLIMAVQQSSGVITDSGGLQKEAFILRVPCTTVREETEWVETLDLGWNVLSPTPEQIGTAVTRPLPASTNEMPYGDGNAAEAVVAAMEDAKQTKQQD